MSANIIKQPPHTVSDGKCIEQCPPEFRSHCWSCSGDLAILKMIAHKTGRYRKSFLVRSRWTTTARQEMNMAPYWIYWMWMLI